ncbi:MAG: UPF0179 family protein [Candidatus Hodarchaeales archaeon]|jgi:uncharacterized protein (UPF0179 family)
MTSEKPLKITLLGVKQSKVGNKFLFLGETEGCSDCRLQGACLKLEKGRVYEVANVKDTIHVCNVFEEGVKTVEILDPPYQVSTGAKLAVEGATTTYTPRDCDIVDCQHYYYHCRPSFLKEGEKLRIIDISNQPLECKHGYKLKLISADRIDQSTS